MKPVAICENLLDRRRDEDTVTPWISALDERGIPHEMLDCYSPGVIASLPRYSALIWHYGNFVNADLMEAQNLLDIAAGMGLSVFPDHRTGWTFDDKIAESYALEAARAPQPRYHVFYELDRTLAFLREEARYPLVAKLRRGSGANNVALLRSAREGESYAKKMFSRGVSPAQSLLYKTYSKLQSTHDLATLLSRARRIPDFLRARRFGKGLPPERGYCYFQEYIPNDGFDLKVAVAGGKLSYFARKTRRGDFRASGGGEFYYDRALLTPQIISSTFAAAESLGCQCVGFDYVVDNRTGEGKILEMCFGFDFSAIEAAGGYFDRAGTWHDTPLRVPAEVLARLLPQD